ncbi:Uncharacterized conserved protein YdhG, YjbR/CyaY-like superfamily, DUF1801 family [Paramicrobacterium humi]|uniref:Uncharacterized conserved protein YdhG, YjbR/CyaY-like superfamily, DUF1801 family n=1 Tax=Paramicrobacterium humi TaxID=640635 RepID=A0A1H4MTE8_9MICO|nr:hypothetical protein [Microbacterium humi]SEB86054.1 Uncharacterized conserved protein YdhG, YjbR/CyaY-like superfamily, DUF1801 family [Microbacterium humi]
MADERNTKTGGGFSAAERAAMKQRAAELRAESKASKGAAKKQQEFQACLDAIAALEGTDKKIAERLHVIVSEEAPQLDPKTWYGFPTYARNGKNILFYQPASKFKTRYGNIGFAEDAQLDEGEFWATAYAVLDVTPDAEKQLRALVKKAAG